MTCHCRKIQKSFGKGKRKTIEKDLSHPHHQNPPPNPTNKPQNTHTMARRRTKKRTQKVAEEVAKASASAPIHGSASRTPKTMVIRIGASEVGPSVSQLVMDVRKMMEPHTAARLKVRKHAFYTDGNTPNCCLGEKIEQTEGLLDNGWSPRCHSTFTLLQSRVRKRQPADSQMSQRPNHTFQS